MQLASVRRKRKISNGGTGWPADAGTPSWCHGFCQRENNQISIITMHRTTSAKTRATATLRQRHISPTVRCKRKSRNIIHDMLRILK